MVDQSQANEVNFDSFIRLSLFLFRLEFFDFQPLDNGSNRLQKVIFFAKRSYVIICIVAFILGTISGILYSMEHSNDFLDAAGSISIVVTGLVTTMKPLIVAIFRDEISNLFQEMRIIFHRRLNQRYGVKKYLDGYHFHMKIYVGIMVVFSLPIIFPIWFSYFIYGTMEMPVKYWFPFDAFKPSTFPIVIIWTDWVAWVSLIYITATDSLLYVLIIVIAMEFDFLKIELMNLKFLPNQERAEKIKLLIDHHNKLLSTSDKLQDIYSLEFLFSFVGSSMIMCIIVFRLVMAADDADLSVYSFFVPYFAMTAGSILYLCYVGQKLINASESVAEGVYFCDWESFKQINIRKLLVPMLIRSQRNKRLTAMKFADISLVSFTTVSFKTLNESGFNSKFITDNVSDRFLFLFDETNVLGRLKEPLN